MKKILNKDLLNKYIKFCFGWEKEGKTKHFINNNNLFHLIVK